jgi:hypothetical protein
LGDLATAGLTAGAADSWRLTPSGHQALAEGAIHATRHQRCAFSFLDRADQGLPPHFVPLGANAVAAADQNWPFEASVLEECIRRPEAWKVRHHFPSDVTGVLFPTAIEPDWQRVVLDRVGHLVALMLEVEARGIVAFAVEIPGWALRLETPILELQEGLEEIFPDVTGGPPAQEWVRAWQSWCQPRRLPRAEVDACNLAFQGNVLRVDAPPRLVERLRAANSDAVKQEAWLLAGTGRTRAAARIDLREKQPD